MSYYETFKPEAEKVVGELFASVTNLTMQVQRITKRLEDEKNNKTSLEERIAKLKELADDSLSADQNSFEKFRTSLKKLTTEFDASEEICWILESEILPKKHRELQDCATNLKIKLNVFLLKSRTVADVKINSLLRECVAERQSFLDDFTKLFSDYGLTFIVNDESFCPGVWNGREIHDLKLRLGIESAPESVSTPKLPQDEPVLKQTPAEGSLIPPEARSQAVEAQTASGEAFETKPEPAVTVLGITAETSVAKQG